MALPPRLLLDTHILARWLGDLKKLSREQLRVLDAAVNRKEPIAVSAVSFLEIALLCSDGKLSVKLPDFLEGITRNPFFVLLPITAEIASDVVYLGPLRDPFDQTIVATARVIA